MRRRLWLLPLAFSLAAAQPVAAGQGTEPTFSGVYRANASDDQGPASLEVTSGSLTHVSQIPPAPVVPVTGVLTLGTTQMNVAGVLRGDALDLAGGDRIGAAIVVQGRLRPFGSDPTAGVIDAGYTLQTVRGQQTGTVALVRHSPSSVADIEGVWRGASDGDGGEPLAMSAAFRPAEPGTYIGRVVVGGAVYDGTAHAYEWDGRIYVAYAASNASSLMWLTASVDSSGTLNGMVSVYIDASKVFDGFSMEGPKSSSVSIPPTLFVATLNAQLFSPLMCYLTQTLPAPDPTDPCQTADRTGDLSDYILHESPHRDLYDVIALQEIWDEDSKDTLVSDLSGRYPYYVEKIEDDMVAVSPSGTIAKELQAEDSGLMLFSRHPILPLDQWGDDWIGSSTHFEAPWDDVETNAPFSTAFVRFGSCVGADCLASKGAGLVRILKDTTEYSVVFTHTQAFSGTENAESRKQQMFNVRYLIEHALTDAQQQDQVLVLGDLNIDGDWIKSDPEWVDLFGHHGSYDHFRGWDLWFETSSREDRGLTSPYGWNERYDYILGRYPAPEGSVNICPQHLRNDFHGLSDHWGVIGDFALDAPMCAPLLAWTNPSHDGGWLSYGPAPNHERLSIRYPSNVQWYRLEEPGTYSIATRAHTPPGGTPPPGDMNLEIYEATDLTNPIGQYESLTSTFVACELGDNCEEVVGRTWAVPQAPFFVKVSGPTRNWIGEYDIAIKKHECTDPDNDVCVLFANMPETIPDLPPDKPVNEEDALWFRVDTDAVFSGKPQNLQFVVSNPNGQVHSARLMDGSKTTVASASSPADVVITGTDVPDHLRATAQTFFLRVKRPDPVGGVYPTGLGVRFTTNLLIMHGRVPGLGGSDGKGRTLIPWEVKVEDETDGAAGTEFGSDEVGICFYADGVDVGCPIWDVEVDEGRSVKFEQAPIGYVEFLQIGFCEVDGPFDPDNCSWKDALSTLPDDRWRSWKRELPENFEEGIWVVHHNLSRQVQAFVG